MGGHCSSHLRSPCERRSQLIGWQIVIAPVLKATRARTDLQFPMLEMKQLPQNMTHTNSGTGLSNCTAQVDRNTEYALWLILLTEARPRLSLRYLSRCRNLDPQQLLHNCQLVTV